MRVLPFQLRIHSFSTTALAMSTTMSSTQQPLRSTIHTTPAAFFDAHNHIHLSKLGGIPPLTQEKMHLHLQDQHMKNKKSMETCNFDDDEMSTSISSHAESILNAFSSDENLVARESYVHIRGIAIMSTQPRDFPIVKQLAKELHIKRLGMDLRDDTGMHVVRCYGVHPWFLKQANADFADFAVANEKCSDLSQNVPAWLSYLKYNLEADPSSHVGEIGLDGARYDIDPLTNEKVLAATIESQIEAFESQMHLAADLKRSVSVHAVHCWGQFMNSMKNIKMTRMKMRKDKISLRKQLEREIFLSENEDEKNLIAERLKDVKGDFLVLPPKIYFHAFGGKPAVVDQLDAICREKSMPSYVTETFYGFAPFVNFRAPKTEHVMQKVGIGRLVLESDLEDFNEVRSDLKAGVEFIARVFAMEEDEVLRQTNANARYFYGFSHDN